MRAVDLIRRKRDGGALAAEEIRAFVAGVTDGSWAEGQIAAMLMAVVWRGMSQEEAALLTDAMVRSGERLDLAEFGGRPVDKHSTGGVGDKLSLVVAPLAAACGAIVPMMSGRGLGHTGGTLDKLEAIPGFRVRLSPDEIRGVLRQTGCALVGQTAEIAPADRRLYALRDITATVESIPLICASILSKKIAEGARGLVLDVKVGPGAFMKTVAEARELAIWLTTIAGRQGVQADALLTPMTRPIGRAVGNANEVVEAIETLKGRGPADVEALSLRLTARMLLLADLAADETQGERLAREALGSGRGLERLRAIVTAQGGDARVLDDYGRLPQPAVVDRLRATADGVITRLDAELVGRAAVALGAGRSRVEDAIDPAAGIEVLAPVGARVSAGDALLELRAATHARVDEARALLQNAVGLGRDAPAPEAVVLETIAGAPAR